jgi:hypothetical protein
MESMPIEQKHLARLEMHLPGGYSRVQLELGGGVGLAGGDTHWDIPTDSIPLHLRKLGSRFWVVGFGLTGRLEAERLTPDQIRSSIGYRGLEIVDQGK